MSKATKLQESEKNDCVVKSMMHAFELTYNQAHAFCKEKMDRVHKKGVNKAKWEPIIKDKVNFGFKCAEIGEKIGNAFGMFTRYENVRTGTEIVCQMTVGTFLDIHKYQTGTYILNVRKHMFVVKDGVVLGNSEDETKKRVIVLGAYKVERAEK